MKEQITITLERKLVNQIDEKRGKLIPRSRYIEHELQRALKASS